MSGDLIVTTTSFGVDDKDWLASAKGLHKYPVTVYTGFLIEAYHYPNGFLKSGLMLGLLSDGAGNGYYTPWVEDGGAAGAVGEEVIVAAVFEGPQINVDSSGSPVATRVQCSALFPEDNTRIIAAKLPTMLLTNDSTENTATEAQLQTAGFSTFAV